MSAKKISTNATWKKI